MSNKADGPARVRGAATGEGAAMAAARPPGLSPPVAHPFTSEINTWAWLESISAEEGKPIDLGSVPERHWDQIAGLGFDSVWLMGVWRRSPAGIGIALAALVDWRSVPIIAAMIFLEGLVEPIRNINQLSLRLTLMPKAMRGRLTSVVRFMIRGAYPIGTLAGGVAGELLGVRNALWLAILAGPLGAALFLGSGIRKYRRLPDMRD